jgi:hypothetical protein
VNIRILSSLFISGIVTFPIGVFGQGIAFRGSVQENFSIGNYHVYQNVFEQLIDLTKPNLPVLPHGTKYYSWTADASTYDYPWYPNRTLGHGFCFDIWTRNFEGGDTDTRIWALVPGKNGANEYMSINDDWSNTLRSRARIWIESLPNAGYGLAQIYISVYNSLDNNDTFLFYYTIVGYDAAACNDGGSFLSVKGSTVTYSNTF